MNEYITSSVTSIDPSVLFNDGFELSEQNIIPSSNFTGSFVQGKNLVEFHIYDANTNHIYSDYNFEGWSISNQNTDTQEPGATDTVVLTPDEDILKAGYQNGTLYAIYNFINLELNSSFENKYFISQISSDRTEIALQSNFIGNAETAAAFSSLKESIDSAEFFDEFYLSFGNNEYVIGINLELQETEDTFNILVKLYEPLPGEYQLQDEVYVATKVGETQAYQVEFIEDYSSLLDNANYIKGPNINIELKDLVNNSTTLKSKSDLLDTDSSQSLDKLTEVLNKKGVTITPNYSYNTFNEFVNFSSAKSRINNFVEKVASIQAYQADLDALIATTASNPNVGEISSSIASLETNIQNIIKNFDGFESYQYYTSESNAGGFTYPKTGSAYPYTLLSTTDTNVLEWLGSDVESNQYYGGYRLSASLYDENNQNWLYYTIPDFIKENSDNNQYIEFSNMVGQHFDEIWLYTKALSERFDTTNDPDSGLPLGLAEEAVKGLGFPAFGNNYNNQDNFIGLTGEDNGSYVPPTGSETITQYIAVNNGEVVNYWNLEYSYLNYVEQLDDPGYPYAIDKVSKEIFKRLYHNMAYLTKKKGTISGLRQLINIWGIPNTILRINEFGGKNKDNSDDYDLWYNRYSLAYHPVSTQNYASSSIRIPWQPLERNRIADGEYIVPDGFAFRFKTTGIPSSSYAGTFYSQSLASKKSNGNDADSRMDFAVMLNYSPKTSGSYSGSSNPDDEAYGELTFQLKGDPGEGSITSSVPISLPFFDKGWWSVLVQRDTHPSASVHTDNTTYTIYAKNKQYNGYDGNNIGWEGSASFTIDGSTSSSYNESWNSFGIGQPDGLYVGGYISGSRLSASVDLQPAGKIFSGSLQEFRYYSNEISESVFNDFVMNPESIEGNNITGSEASFDIVNFRAPLGNELEHIFTSSLSSSYSESIDSSHPAITGSAASVITASFVDPSDDSVTSSYDFIVYENITTRTFSKPNREVYFLDQPSIGIRNRVTNKIQVEDGDQYGTILSREVSIDQDYQISRSYTEDITSLEVAFSPQDEVNDDIIQTFGYGVISDALADPRHLSSSDSYYPKLRSTAEEYFKKYTKGNIYDYLRLIKYFDNSIFKAIKSYVPARTSVTTGVVIKQHMLERNRRPPVILDPTTKVAINSSSSFNENIELGNLEITASIPVGTFEGGPGGVVNEFNIPQQISGSIVYIESDAALAPGSGESNVFDETNFTVTPTASGLFEFQSQLVAQITSSEYTTYYDENIPLIFGLTYRQSNADAEFALTLKDQNDDIIQQLNFVDPGFQNVVRTVFFEPVFPTADGSYKFTVDVTGGTANLYNFTASVLTTYPTGGYGPNTIYNVSTTPSFLEPLPSGYDYELNRYNLRQGYINNVPTTLGTQAKSEIHEKEFYDGEYSGSEFIGTSQSLFNNPYTVQSLIDTSYDVETELEPWQAAFSLGFGQYTASIVHYVGTSGWRNPSVDEIEYSASLMTDNEMYMLFLSKTVGDDQWQPAGIIINLNRLFLQGAEGGIAPGLYPSASDSGTPTSPGGFWNSHRAGPEIPNFFLHLSSSFLAQGSWSTSVVSNYNKYGGDLLSGGLKLLGEIPNKGVNYDFDLSNPSNRYVWYRFQVGSSHDSLRLWGSGDPLFDIAAPTNQWNKSEYYLNQGNATDRSRVKYMNPDFGFDSWKTGLSTSSLPPGSASAYFVPATLIATGSEDVIYTALRGLAFNTFDKNNNNNQNTIANNPQYDITLDASGSAPTWTNSRIFDSSNFAILGQNTIPGDDSDVISFTLGLPSYGQRESTFLNSHVTNSEDVFFNFNPILPSDFNFDNSQYNALFNNVSESRPSDKIEEIDYTNGITTPANISAIKSGSAIKARTPDSNYASKTWSTSRYLGSELKSLTYNKYTPSGSDYSASNGDVIDWEGDISYGNQAVINKNPIYFAHFKKSYHNLQLEDTFTFEIDSLIISPSNNITGTDVIPTTIKVDGSNELLFPIKSTFEVGRKAIIAYDNTNFTGPDGQAYDFSQLKVGSSEIFQGALEMQTIGASTTYIYGTNPEAVYPNFLPTMSFVTASWIFDITSSDSQDTGSYPGESNVYEPNVAGLSAYLLTGSNCVFLAGGYWKFGGGFQPGSNLSSYWTASYWGPGLGLLHSLNVNASMSNITSQGGLGIPIGTKTVDPLLTQNYFVFDYTGSNMPGYVDNQLPFIIKENDEIRISYNISNAPKGTSPALVTQDFRVTKVDGYQSGDGGGFEADFVRYSGSYPAGDEPITSDDLYNRIYLDPDPSTLDIPRGEINQFTIRRRVNADDRVIVYQTPPSGAYGVEQATEGGFIIPDDFTAQQKRNALTLINQLKEKNAFTRDNSGRSTT